MGGDGDGGLHAKFTQNLQEIQFIANSPTFNDISYFSKLIRDSFDSFEFMQFLAKKDSWVKLFFGFSQPLYL